MTDAYDISTANADFLAVDYEAAIRGYARVAGSGDRSLRRNAVFNLFLAQSRLRRNGVSTCPRVMLYVSKAAESLNVRRLAELEAHYAGTGANLTVVDAQTLRAATDDGACSPDGDLSARPSSLIAAAYRFLISRPVDQVVLVGPSQEALAFGAMARLIWRASVVFDMPEPGASPADHEVLDIWREANASSESRGVGRYPLGPLEGTPLAKIFEAAGGWDALYQSSGRPAPEFVMSAEPVVVPAAPASDLTVIVYTVLVGEYEALKEPENPDPRVRYMLFTDNPSLQTRHWEVVPLDTLGLSPRRASRLPKLLPHRYLPEHDISLYIDASITLIEPDILSIARDALQGVDIAAYPHFKRNCVFEEIDECIQLGKVNLEKADAYCNKLQKEKFPRQFGLLENAFLLRRSTPLMTRINDLWFKEYISGPERDQFSLMYVLWRACVPYALIDNTTNFRKSPHVRWAKHRESVACAFHPAKKEVERILSVIEAKYKARIKENFGETNGIAKLAKAPRSNEIISVIPRKKNQTIHAQCDFFGALPNEAQSIAQDLINQSIARMKANASKDGILDVNQDVISDINKALIYFDLIGDSCYSEAQRSVSDALFGQASAHAFGARKLAYIPNSAMPTSAANNVHVMKMCSALAEQGIDVTIYSECSPGWSGDVKDLHQQFGTISCFPMELVNRGKRRRENLLYRLICQAIADGCSYIYTRSLSVAFYACLADIPVIFEEHKIPKDADFARYRFILRSPALVRFVAISQSLAGFFRALHRDAAGKIAVLHDAADPVGSFKVAKFKLQEMPGIRMNLGYVGHLYPGKGAELSVEIARRMPHIGFHMLGGTEDDVDRWRKETSELPNIVFYGHRPHKSVPGFIEAVDVCIAPFLREVGVSGGGPNVADVFSPLKIFEYMSYGKPIITSDLPVLREILTDGDTALMCDPDTPESFVAAINSLIEDTTEAQAMGARALAHFLANYTWARRAERVRGFLFDGPKLDPCLPPTPAAVLDATNADRRPGSAPPVVRWDFGPKQSGWAYGINTRRITERIHRFQHVFATEQETKGSPDVAVAFDLNIMLSNGFRECGARRQILRVGGGSPLREQAGGDEDRLAQLLQKADIVIALSPQLRDRLECLHPRVCFIPNGIDLTEFHPLRRFRWRNSPFTVGMAASMTSEAERNIKGYYYAIEACLRAKVDLLAIGRGINHVPHERMIEDFYARIDVLLHPVDAGKEGSSNVIMESLAMGIPVITTRYAGFHGIALENGREGLIVGRNSSQLASAITAIRDDSSIYDTLVEGGRAFAERHHNIDNVAQNYEKLIESCL